MENEEILNRNIEIAKFLGWKRLIGNDFSAKREHTGNLFDTPKNTTQFFKPKDIKSYYINRTTLAFDYNWNWLMYAIERIESIDDEYHGHFGVYPSSNTCTIQSTNFKSDELIMPEPPYYFNTCTANSKIEATFAIVSDFCKWYNEKMKNGE